MRNTAGVVEILEKFEILQRWKSHIPGPNKTHLHIASTRSSATFKHISRRYYDYTTDNHIYSTDQSCFHTKPDVPMSMLPQ